MNPIIDIFDGFERIRSEIEMTREQMLSYLEPYSGNVLLYGAGSSGIAFLYDLKKIGMLPRFFIDANEKKIGSKCEGVEIIMPEEVIERVDGDFIVIVCINTDGKRYCKSFDEALRIGGHHGVYERLHKAGCEKVIDYSFFRRCFSIFADEKYNAPSCSDIDMMVGNKDEISRVYELLGDDLSRETYEKIVKFRLLDDSIQIPTLTQETQYFEEGLYHSREDAVFVDCGAYNGISARTFLKIQGEKFEGYYGSEPDPANYGKLMDYLASLPEKIQNQMTVTTDAFWDREAGLKLYSLDGPGSFVSQDSGTIAVKAVTIDGLLNGDKATFIKMNIEGSEKQALKGARKTIEKFKPELAIAGYHRTDDLWKIPLMMREMRDDYIINLRSYMNHMSFVYYAN